MNKLKLILIFVVGLANTACSHSTPEVVSSLSELHFPVIPPSSLPVSQEQEKITRVYLSNRQMVGDLTSFLKNKYLKGAKKEDMFDTHSLSHKIYISLTNLERTGLINQYYYNEKNMEGLRKVQESLSPFMSHIH